MRLLLTRPRDDAEELAKTLKLGGHQPIVAPLMRIRAVPGAEIPLAGVQAVIATSANGIRAFSARATVRNLPVFAVGPQTAEAAKRAGFTEVINSDGDAAALALTISQRVDPSRGGLLHAAGAETAGRLSESLRQRGFDVKTVVLYEAVPVAELPPEAADPLQQEKLDGVLLFSPRSASIFAELVSKEGLDAHCERLTAFCISKATADGLSPLRFARVAVAAKSNQQAVLDLLGATEASA
jgi:uroporphyrinogen-III synthase